MKTKLKPKRKTYSFRITPDLVEKARKRGYDIPSLIETALKEALGIISE